MVHDRKRTRTRTRKKNSRTSARIRTRSGVTNSSRTKIRTITRAILRVRFGEELRVQASCKWQASQTGTGKISAFFVTFLPEGSRSTFYSLSSTQSQSFRNPRRKSQHFRKRELFINEFLPLLYNKDPGLVQLLDVYNTLSEIPQKNSF